MNKPTHKAKSLDGTWAEGWYDGSNPESQLIWFAVKEDRFSFYEIAPSTLCRSTYRTDSNGTLMYEGDEVMYLGKMYNIEWVNSICGFVLKHEDGTFIPFNRDMDHLLILTGKNIKD